MAKKGVKSMFVGLEMTAPENTGRFYQMADMDKEEFVQLPILYPDVKQISQKDIDALFDSARENGCQILFFDHLHYLARSVTHSQEEIGVIVNNFKRAAVRTNIHAVLISHVVKNVRRDRIPSPGDLKGSSFIEQDADMVIAVWRDMERDTGEVLLKIWKNRNRGFNPEESVATLQVLDKVRLAEQVNLAAFGG
jgi:replicative DNA helicase